MRPSRTASECLNGTAFGFLGGLTPTARVVKLGALSPSRLSARIWDFRIAPLARHA